jgi:hypothetical protein
MDPDNLQYLKKLRKIIFSHFLLILDENLILKKKKFPNLSYIAQKNNICLKLFQLWVSGRYWSIIGQRVADKVCSVPKSRQNFLYPIDSKIDDFNEKTYPPPHFHQKNEGGGICFFNVVCTKFVLT